MSQSGDLVSLSTVVKDRWTFVRKIGGGGFGEIYEGRETTSGQRCAIKVESAVGNKQVRSICNTLQLVFVCVEFRNVTIVLIKLIPEAIQTCFVMKPFLTFN